VTQAISLGNETKARGFLARAIFPSIQVRFAVALLLTFFPRAIFYPLDYPAGELITLCCWLWVFPSRLGWLSLILAPMIPNSTYGYYAFNLLCLVATLAIAISAHNSTELHFKELSSLHRFAKGCMLVTLVLAAAQAAIALKARRLVFMSDVPGLLRDPQKPDSIIPHLQTGEVDGLKKSGVIDKGMIPKADSAVAAIKSGVEKVSFVDGRVPHAVLLEIFTDEGVGTEIVL